MTTRYLRKVRGHFFPRRLREAIAQITIRHYRRDTTHKFIARSGRDEESIRAIGDHFRDPIQSVVFFDLFPQDALAGKVAIAVATGAGPAHGLVVDHALRPLLASVGALVVPAGIYGTDGQFGPDGPDPALLAGVDRAVSEALEVIGHVAR